MQAHRRAAGPVKQSCCDVIEMSTQFAAARAAFQARTVSAPSLPIDPESAEKRMLAARSGGGGGGGKGGGPRGDARAPPATPPASSDAVAPADRAPRVASASVVISRDLSESEKRSVAETRCAVTLRVWGGVGIEDVPCRLQVRVAARPRPVVGKGR
jgi:hypothetical protein